MVRLLPLLALLAACAEEVAEPEVYAIGGFTVRVEDDGLAIETAQGQVIEGLRFEVGSGTQDISWSAGAWRFENEKVVWEDLPTAVRTTDDPALAMPPRQEVSVSLSARGEQLAVHIQHASGVGTDRIRLSADCDADDHFLGFGSHAMDLDHVGQAFPLWVSEPGVGKTEDEQIPEAWFLVGTRHASSYPVPWLLRPHKPIGLLVDTEARVEADLCATKTGRFSLEVWAEETNVVFVHGASPLEVVENLSDITGRPRRLPRWALAPWTDAIKGVDRVLEVADAMRDAGAPGSVMWTEDWKGAQPNFTGYRLSESWTVDTDLYPEPADIADTLLAGGWKWFAYFAPFIGAGADVGAEALEAGVTIKQEDGTPYIFDGVNTKPTTLVDLSTEPGRVFARERMQAAVDLGFRGWMADFAEWLPHDARLDDGSLGLDVHNGYPKLWQEVNGSVLDPVDGVYFCRSGWAHTAGTCPVVWLGDQATDFSTTDGYPTILPLALGLSASGVPVVTHDVAGYQSFGTTPRDAELFFRWASLGAFSPILRTHHGSSETANHQLDSDEDTLNHWTFMATEHMRLWPYRDGLAAQASERGTPMLLPTSFLFGGEDWGRMDAWMLGSALLVAPVLDKGATSRDVQLPDGVTWYDWWTLSEATSGTKQAPVSAIPVFAASGTTVPLFDVVPDTLVDEATDEGLVTFDEADASRLVLLFGGGGPFTEGDGTRYTPSGTPTSTATVSQTLTSGSVDVGGVTVEVSGPRERTYTFQVVR